MPKPKPKAKRPPGRPSLYDPAYARQARNLCLLGATNADLARAFEVDDATISRWLAAHEEFRGAVKAGREEADARVANALFRRAVGYRHKAVKIGIDARSGTHHEVAYTERYPPDTTAATFWLKNRRPDLWRDKSTLELVDVDGFDPDLFSPAGLEEVEKEPRRWKEILAMPGMRAADAGPAAE